MAVGIGGCSDACEAACRETTDALGACMPDWPLDWTDLGAADARDFEARCIDDWNRLSGDLESWEMEEALATCSAISDDLSGADCNLLLARYAP